MSVWPTLIVCWVTLFINGACIGANVQLRRKLQRQRADAARLMAVLQADIMRNH